MLRISAALTLALTLVVAPVHAQSADPANTVRMETTKGVVTFVLRPDLAPKHAERIKLLIAEKFYDNAPFHRVIAGFMAQTGDGSRGDGTGGSKHPNLPAEFSAEPFVRGVVGMARARDPNSANSQFFIMYAPAPNLDRGYTVIGKVTSGMEVVDSLNKGPASDNGRVPNPDRIVSMSLGR
ncbi:MAG: peptidylprolyl isomerase [Variibacter sp.]|nr:peptidylprolyl isomerase [Variibacter sp.]